MRDFYLKVLKYSNMKNCFKNFVVDVKKSIYGKDYKGDFASRTIGQGIGFISKLTSLEMLLIIVMALFILIPFTKFALDRNHIAGFVDSYIPKDVEVTIKDGKVSTPDNKPVIVPVSKKTESENKIENALVVDPNITEKEIEKFEKYKTAVLVTNDKIVSVEENTIKVTTLNDVPDYVITRDSVIGLYESVRPYLYLIIPVISLFIAIFGFIFVMLFTLITNFFTALITLLISKIKKVEISYKEAYLISLFALAPATIISWLTFWIKPIGLLGLIILIVIFVSINLINTETKSVN
jgi:hypothetical protein